MLDLAEALRAVCFCFSASFLLYLLSVLPFVNSKVPVSDAVLGTVPSKLFKTHEVNNDIFIDQEHSELSETKTMMLNW